MNTYKIIEKHDWRDEVVGFEVRAANAPEDTAADEIAYVATRAEAEAVVARLTKEA